MRDILDLDTIAMHEAGHVLVAHYYGRKVYGAYLSKQLSRQSRPLSRYERSHVRFALTPHIQEVHLDLDRLDERWPLAVWETLVTTRIRLAGPMAQSICQQTSYRNIAGGQDYHDALVELLRFERLRLSLPNPEHLDISYKHEDILDTLADEIMALFGDPVYRHYLDRIAQSLLEKEELSALEISTMLETMPGHQWFE